jgi:hypothetical protein
MTLTDRQFKLALVLVFGALASIASAAPVPPEFKSVAIAVSGLLTALAAAIDPNRDHVTEG